MRKNELLKEGFRHIGVNLDRDMAKSLSSGPGPVVLMERRKPGPDGRPRFDVFRR